MERHFKKYIELVKETPNYHNWEGGSIHEYPVLVENLTDDDKTLATIAAYTCADLACGYKTLEKVTGLSRKVLKNILRGHKNKVELVPTFNEDTGLLNGSGWVFWDAHFC